MRGNGDTRCLALGAGVSGLDAGGCLRLVGVAVVVLHDDGGEPPDVSRDVLDVHLRDCAASHMLSSGGAPGTPGLRSARQTSEAAAADARRDLPDRLRSAP